MNRADSSVFCRTIDPVRVAKAPSLMRIRTSLFARTAGEWPGDGFSHAEWSGEQIQPREGKTNERVTDKLMAWRPSALFVTEFTHPEWKLLSYFETWILVVAKLELAVLV
jgi:hypothetical protein